MHTHGLFTMCHQQAIISSHSVVTYVDRQRSRPEAIVPYIAHSAGPWIASGSLAGVTKDFDFERSVGVDEAMRHCVSTPVMHSM